MRDFTSRSSLAGSVWRRAVPGIIGRASSWRWDTSGADAACYIKPYIKRGKNDAVDAAAICEAMSRPGMRFVPIKSADQQAVLMLHKTREMLVKQRTMSVNALRGHLAEFGLIVAKGIGRVDELLELAQRRGTSANCKIGRSCWLFIWKVSTSRSRLWGRDRQRP